jgi:hypothetical protein
MKFKPVGAREPALGEPTRNESTREQQHSNAR